MTHLTLVRHYVPVQILRVCVTVQKEAEGIMMKRLQEIREMTPMILLEKDVAAFTERCRLMATSRPIGHDILNYVLLWFEVMKGNEHISFRQWRSIDPRIAGRAEQIPRFVQQAGIQMLSRWTKFEYYGHSSNHGWAGVSIFLALQLKSHSLLAPKAEHHRPLCSSFLDFPVVTDNKGRLMVGLNLHILTVSGEHDEFTYMWNVAVNSNEKETLKVLMPEVDCLWHRLNMCRGGVACTKKG